ncbi:plasmid transfer operon, TraF, protein [Vibrio xiamenensis]|uniref:Plasmid transfer operon, TraF, protein n=1 Tax=Vibrio xiamenensis TaxID=861298 RepID=A0A1G7YR18_9VIBR|nr:conjugal transfer protein TraF [Vibrio xiamenensis]SDG99003.1 plasmid transfer operon, TraF, protein [Vibrio xiamenensis]
MKKLTTISIAVAVSLSSASVFSATTVADARGNGMGNTGVTTADYLLAPFYNPALTAVSRDNDDFGLLLPAIGASVRDSDDTLTTLDDLQSDIESFEDSPTTAAAEDLNDYLNELEDDAALNATVGVGAAIAIPARMVSVNMFARGYAEIIAIPMIAADAGTNPSDVQTRYENSSVRTIAFGYGEFGVALAKQFAIAGQQFAFGVSPKYQQLKTYKQDITVQDFDIEDFDQSETSKSAFNMDLGAVWLIDDFRVGLAAKDLFSQSIDTIDSGNKYKLDTQVTVSGAYVTEFFTATLDWDLTKQTRFSGVDDDTQFVRVGIEGNAWGWAQLRAGYQIDTQDTLDNTITAGIGISPADVVSLDVSGSYAGENELGVSGNLAFTF